MIPTTMLEGGNDIKTSLCSPILYLFISNLNLKLGLETPILL